MGVLARNDLIDHRYRVVRWIGEGACAVVYEAVDTHEQDRPVAVKVMSAELMGNATFQRRFVQEAEAAIHIDSPFVVSVHAVNVQDDGCPYIVMELLDGEDLGQLLDRVGRLDEHRSVELAIHALSGLAHAHARGVLHRDIKPANLFIVRGASGDELLKIVDLGIAKLVSDGPEGRGLTRTNSVLGSPVYMSPEQCRGAKNMDHRSDVYSVGVVLYECLTGQLPHDGENVNELMFKIALEDAPSPMTHTPTLDPALSAIVMKALARDIDERFSSASAFREALLEWGAEHGARVPPAPSSRRLPPAPRSSRRRLEVTLEEDAPAPGGATGVSPADSDAVLVGSTTPVPARLADSLEPSTSRAKKGTTAVLVAAAACCLAVIVLVVTLGGAAEPPSPGTAASASAAPSATAAQASAGAASAVSSPETPSKAGVSRAPARSKKVVKRVTPDAAAPAAGGGGSAIVEAGPAPAPSPAVAVEPEEDEAADPSSLAEE